MKKVLTFVFVLTVALALAAFAVSAVSAQGADCVTVTNPVDGVTRTTCKVDLQPLDPSKALTGYTGWEVAGMMTSVQADGTLLVTVGKDDQVQARYASMCAVGNGETLRYFPKVGESNGSCLYSGLPKLDPKGPYGFNQVTGLYCHIVENRIEGCSTIAFDLGTTGSTYSKSGEVAGFYRVFRSDGTVVLYRIQVPEKK